MKKLIYILLIFTTTCNVFSQGTAINTTGAFSDTSAILDVSSINKGILIPRMTEAQKTGIILPATGLLVFQTDGTSPGYYYNAGTPLTPSWTLLGFDNLGNHSASQDLDMNSYKVTEVANPTSSTDGVNAQTVQSGALIYASDSGSTDAYAINLSPALTAYAAGMVLTFKANTSNTGVASLNVNGLGAVAIKKNYDTDLADNDIKAGQNVIVMYDGTNFQMLSQLGNSSTGSGSSTVSKYSLQASCKWSPATTTTWTFAEMYPQAVAAGEDIQKCFFNVGFNNGSLYYNYTTCSGTWTSVGGSCWSCSNIGTGTTWSSTAFSTGGCISGINAWAIMSNGNVLICIR